MNLKLIVISLAVAVALMRGVAPAHSMPLHQGKPRSPGNSLTLAKVKKQGPLCGMRVSIVGGTEEARTQPAIVTLKRLDGVKEHLTAWNDRLISTSGRIEREVC